MKKNILLFDLGGVVVPWVGIDELAKLTQSTRDDVNDRLASSEVFHAYERGLCSDEAFLNDIVSLFNLDMKSSEFAALWKSWVWTPYPGVVEALKTLRQNYTLATLTNNNALHWARVNSLIDIDSLFDFVFASHLIHAAKPDEESFLIPLKAMETTAEKVIFFDDTLENLVTAERLGIESHHVDRNQGVMPNLRSLGLLSS